jgi:hypothetical protein
VRNYKGNGDVLTHFISQLGQELDLNCVVIIKPWDNENAKYLSVLDQAKDDITIQSRKNG